MLLKGSLYFQQLLSIFFSAAIDANVCAKQAANPNKQYWTGSGLIPLPPKNGGASPSTNVEPFACSKVDINCTSPSSRFQVPSTLLTFSALLLSFLTSSIKAPAFSISTLFIFI